LCDLKVQDGSISVGFTGEVIRLLVAEECGRLVARIEQPMGSFRKHTDREYRQFFGVPSSGSREIVVWSDCTFAKIELLPDGEILVVASGVCDTLTEL